ncbi:MAG TPA: hypothetical protein VES02_01045 [Dermatophilaceae bacterium]|nr:hypothetical protein [Dermatophilaceae bacterium]
MRRTHRGTTLAIAVLLVSAALPLSACSDAADGPDPSAVIEVSGTGQGTKTRDGDMRGKAMRKAGLPGSEMRGAAYSHTLELSDPRVSGEQVTMADCDYTEQGDAVVGDCWGTVVITNDGGTWDGTFTGTTAWSTTEPEPVYDINATYLGSGEYAGLRFVAQAEGTDTACSMTGRIEPAG